MNKKQERESLSSELNKSNCPLQFTMIVVFCVNQSKYNKMNDEEEGFTCDSNTEFIELSYIPIYSPNRHLAPNNQVIPQSLLNQSLQ